MVAPTLARAARRLWTPLSAAALVLLVACGGATAAPSGGSTDAGTRYGLAAASDSTCAQRGLALARYLDTGQPSAYDAAYGVPRNQVLGFRGMGQTEQATILIRQTADGAISDCEQAEKNARSDPPDQAFRIACSKLGGEVESLNRGRGCFVTYGNGVGAAGGWAALNQDGTFNDQLAAANERECASFPPTTSGDHYRYYADSGVCADQ
jgi:hypothetical protein